VCSLLGAFSGAAVKRHGGVAVTTKDGYELDAAVADISSVAGFRVGAAASGIKATGGLDVGVILCDREDCAGAAVFTRNEVAAAPVRLSRPRAEAGRLRAVVVNSGNANCCTGERGAADAEEMAALAARLLGIEADEERVLVASTGVIGRRLDMEKVRAGVEGASRQALESGRGNLAAAIMTTDLVQKKASASGTLSGGRFKVAGVAKGSGMIAPNMATMLAFVATDAAVEPGCLRGMLVRVSSRTFNRVTVDGDTSTNDTFCVIASGAAGNPPVRDASSPEGRALEGALEAVAAELARAIAADGEGAKHLVEVRVRGAAGDSDADLAARAIANSPLVKTAVYGADPNWGRILAAAGRSGARVDESKASVSLSGVVVFRRGEPTADLPQGMSERLGRFEVSIELDLGLGAGEAVMWTCDLTDGYVGINARYHT
jgi:glutamate N-acetyltransferase/amino-acid N-acetyltransferase